MRVKNVIFVELNSMLAYTNRRITYCSQTSFLEYVYLIVSVLNCLLKQLDDRRAQRLLYRYEYFGYLMLLIVHTDVELLFIRMCGNVVIACFLACLKSNFCI